MQCGEDLHTPHEELGRLPSDSLLYWHLDPYTARAGATRSAQRAEPADGDEVEHRAHGPNAIMKRAIPRLLQRR